MSRRSIRIRNLFGYIGNERGNGSREDSSQCAADYAKLASTIPSNMKPEKIQRLYSPYEPRKR